MFDIFRRNKNKIDPAKYEQVVPEPIQPVEEAWIALRPEIDAHNQRLIAEEAERESKHLSRIKRNAQAWELVVAFAIKRGIETKKLGASIVMHSEGACPIQILNKLERSGYAQEYQVSALRLVVRWTPDVDAGEIYNSLNSDEIFHVDGLEDYQKMTGHTVLHTEEGVMTMKPKRKRS